MKNIFQVLVCVFISSYGFGQKINSDVSDRFMDQEIVDCIIVMQDQLDLYGKTEGMKKEAKAEFVFSKLKSHAKKSQGDLSMYLTNENISFVDYYVFNGFQAYLSQQQAEYIIENFKVDQIVYNQPAQAAKPQKEEYTLDRSMAEWGILQINADSVWAMGFEGEGVVVGGQDTGYDFDNPLILSKYRGYTTEELDHDYNWHDAIDTINPLHGDTINDPSLNPCGFLSSEPCDDHGHGTHTMGTMVGNDSINDIGVAPAASWIGCRNMERGWGKPSTYTECFEWFLAPTDLEGQNPDPSKSPHVINNSWGCPTMEGCNIDNWMFMETVVNNLSAAGTVVVVSAGNSGGSGCGSVSNPAAIFDNSFTVGASNNSDGKAGFSSIGPVTVDSTFRIKPDVVAPGVGVRSIYLDEEFRTWNGTSMAGPHVAGAVALIINANPALAGEVDVIKDILKSTAIPLIDSTACLGNMALEVPNFYFGHGRIDALAAVRKAVDMISNVEDVEAAEKVIVYPNPNNGTMTIEVGQSSSIKRVMMTDFTGKIVLSHSYIENRNSHLIEGLLPGMYIYTVQTEAGIHSGKVVVSK